MTTTTDTETALVVLTRELATLRAERDFYRNRWLRQVDVNDRLRAMLAETASRSFLLESMGRE